MKVFHCDHCQHLVFFENVNCVNCGRLLAYLFDARDVVSLEPQEGGIWRSISGTSYRLCTNYSREKVCNWAIPAESKEPFCEACRLNSVIPNLAVDGNREKWYRLEVAKRRLIYNLQYLGLAPFGEVFEPTTDLRFEFLADEPGSNGAPVLTGHDQGRITINVAEADDAERERRRLAVFEPYRTLLGHFRHEIGHFYWDHLIAGSDRIDDYRSLFGDEREDYAAALKKHYDNGPPPDWPIGFVSAYAASHPWEDWAETWAHYLHMTDTLETAAANGLWLRPTRGDEPALKPAAALRDGGALFEQLLDNWFPLTYVVNNLNRGLGSSDAYPFILSSPVIDKLRFVHDTIVAARISASAPSTAP